MRAVATVLALLSCLPAFGATYYVANDGDDANPGDSPQTPWATIARVNAASVTPGDTVLFRRGDMWRGQLRPQSGDESAPVTYGAYGEGELPLLLGSVEKNRPDQWVSEGNNIWSTLEPVASGANVLPNSSFDADMEGWHIHHEGGAAASAARDTEIFDSAPASQRVTCTAAGESGNHIQVSASPFSIASGTLYRLTCRLKASQPFEVPLPRLMKAGPPWDAYAWHSQTNFSVATDWQTFEYLYLSNITADDARLTFMLGGSMPAGATLHIDTMELAPCESGDYLSHDVGNIIFNNAERCGVKVWNESDLDAVDEYWYDEDRHIVKLVSEMNPAEANDDIECALRFHIIEQGGKHHVVYENLHCRFGGAHGIGGGSTHHITVRDCDFSYIGGGDQMGGDRTVRFGNGVEFWGAAHDCLVERCRLWEIYDAALTNQSSGPETPHYNIVYRNNLIWNSEYSFEYWNRPEASETYDIYFENNTCLNAGYGWGHTQRPDPSGRHLCFYTSPARARDIVIRNNIFDGALGNAFYAPAWPQEGLDALLMDSNCWRQPEGAMISLLDRKYTQDEFAEYQANEGKERHSFVADPMLANAPEDFRLRDGSPCIDAGAANDVDQDFAGTARPQGKATDIGAYER